MRMLRATSLVALLALAGCATVGGPSPQQQAQAQQARSLAQQGQYDQAAQAYMQLADQGYGARDYFRLRAAEAWREEGALDRAAQALDGVSRRRLSPQDANHLDLLQAEIALAHGDVQQALALTSAPATGLSPALRLRADELRARAQAKGGMAYAAARTRAAMDPRLSGMDQAQNRRQIVKLLTGLGAGALQQRAQTLTPDDPMQRWIGAALQELGVSVAQAGPSLDHPVGTQLPGDDLRQGYRLPGQVALLLPLSGPLAQAATLVRDGVLSAYFSDAVGGDRRPPLKVYDSGGNPDTALAAYRKAVGEGARLVLGPLTRESVQAVTGQAQLPVPVLALNHAEGGTLPPANVTEFGLLPETEGVEAARHMRERGLGQALVMVSSEEFAQRAAQAFAAQFKADGGQVVATLTLDPQQVNYADAIKSVDTASLAGGGVFISMRPQQARLLLPQLRLARLTQPVFATSHVYGGRDDAGEDRDLDGVEFCDAPWLFDAQSGLPSRASIAADLPAVAGPGARLFAFGMDAWALAPYLDWLRGHPGSYLPGATGQLAEDDFGRVQRVLVWARFSDGIAHQVAGSLDAGTPALQSLPAEPASAPPAPAPAGSALPPAGG